MRSCFCFIISGMCMRDTLPRPSRHKGLIIDGSLGFIGLLALDGSLSVANALALQAGGLNCDEVIGRKFWECYWRSFEDMGCN
jgi:hypothetical protein